MALRQKNLDDAVDGATPAVTQSPYMAPRELSLRWRCSRSSVDRIARREGLKRLLLGSGKNGIVRYLRLEVELLEKRKLVAV